VNRAPSFVPRNLSVVEDSSEHLLQFAASLSSGPPSEAAQTLRWIFSVQGADLFASGPELTVAGADGMVRFTPAPERSGTATISVVLEDSGGSFPVRAAPSALWGVAYPTVREPSGEPSRRDGALATSPAVEPDHWKDAILVYEADDGPVTIVGADRSPAVTFTITVEARNDPPAFDLAARVSVAADAGPQAIPSVATAVSAGPREVYQAVFFRLVDVANAGSYYAVSDFFAAGGVPELALDGTLFFTTGPKVNGKVRVTFELSDSGGTAFAGEDDDALRVIEISVLPVNQQPSFAVSAPHTTLPSSPLSHATRASVAVAGNISRGSPDEEVLQDVTFTILSVSNPGLFAEAPTLDALGVLTIAGAPGATGQATLEVVLHDDGGVDEDGADTSVVRTLVVELVKVNAPPSFALALGETVVVENSGASVLPRFAVNVSAGEEGEEAQRLFFNLSVVGGDAQLFTVLPRISASGTLAFTLAPGQHGSAHLAAILSDDGGTFFGGRDRSLGSPALLSIRVLPVPVPTRIVPALGKTVGGEVVTVTGRAFTPRDGPACAPGGACAGVAVFLGGRQCGNATLLSDEAVTCVAPAGKGLHDVTIRVDEADGLSRAGSLPGAFYQHSLAFGGLSSGGEGFLALGLGDAEADDTSGERAGVFLPPGLRAVADRGVRALAHFQGKVYVGGQFARAGRASAARADDAARHVAAVDGDSVGALGFGLDGTVNTLVSFRGRLIVGGAFTRALQPVTGTWGAATALLTGGLAAWNGAAWELVGAEPLEGVVMVAVVNASGQSGRGEGAEGLGGTLIVGGRFSDPARPGNLALWDGVEWQSICALDGGCGVAGGEVHAIAVNSESLFVAGSFTSAGGVPAPRIARFDGRQWYALGRFDADVHALAVLGGQLFAGGAFTHESGAPASYIAVLDFPSWAAVGDGVGGAVFALQAAGECIFAGGAFQSAGGLEQIDGVKVRGAARFCIDRASRVSPVWKPVPFPDAPPGDVRGQDVDVVRAVALA